MRPAQVMATLATSAALAACGSSAHGTASGGAGSHANGHGTVSVLYAGSLANLMEHALGPAFTRAEGYGFAGVGAGSTALVAQIRSRVRRGDVFLSASPKANRGLEGAANGDYVNWYVAFARAPLVIAYNPSSPFAAQFRHKPWYQVITEAGIHVGRTDPLLDPKGKLTVQALSKAARTLHDPRLGEVKRLPVFPEEALVGRLEAGQLDAGFFYVNEATEQRIPFVGLAPARESATYTVTVLGRAVDRAGAVAFVTFLLGRQGRELLAAHGLTVLKPTLDGDSTAVPPGLRALVGAS